MTSSNIQTGPITPSINRNLIGSIDFMMTGFFFRAAIAIFRGAPKEIQKQSSINLECYRIKYETGNLLLEFNEHR